MRTTIQILTVVTVIATMAACENGRRSGPVQGASAVAPSSEREALYVLESPTAPVAVGAEEAVALKIRPAPGWKINKLYDWNLEFEQPASGRIATTTVAGDDIALEDTTATIPVTLTAGAAGSLEIAATADFSVCNDDKCELYDDVPLQFTVAATSPSP